METRLASLYDAPQLASLHAESFGEAHWNLTQIIDSLTLRSTLTWLTGVGDMMFGFIMCQLVANEGEILTFCVSPAARRQGVGKVLLGAMITALRDKGVRKIFLEVAADNRAATMLYEKMGFCVIGRRVGYYRRGTAAVDAVLFELIL